VCVHATPPLPLLPRHLWLGEALAVYCWIRNHEQIVWRDLLWVMASPTIVIDRGLICKICSDSRSRMYYGPDLYIPVGATPAIVIKLVLHIMVIVV